MPVITDRLRLDLIIFISSFGWMISSILVLFKDDIMFVYGFIFIMFSFCMWSLRCLLFDVKSKRS